MGGLVVSGALYGSKWQGTGRVVLEIVADTPIVAKYLKQQVSESPNLYLYSYGIQQEDSTPQSISDCCLAHGQVELAKSILD